MINLKVKKISGAKKASGLIFAKKAYPILLITRFGIHTLGMKFPIDVLLLDRVNRVVKLIKNLKPNKIMVWHPKYKKVVELPKGWINKKNIKLGTQIELEIYN